MKHQNSKGRRVVLWVMRAFWSRKNLWSSFELFTNGKETLLFPLKMLRLD